jgi:hypothetical protein
MPYTITVNDGTNVSGGNNSGLVFFGDLSVNPDEVDIGDLLVISNTGSGFLPGTVVFVDGYEAAQTVVLSENKIACLVPDEAAGESEVVVTNTDYEQGSAGMIDVSATPVVVSDCIIVDALANAARLIQSMRIANGYNYDWGVSNIEDIALATFPSAVIRATVEEDIDEDGAHASAYQNMLYFDIAIRQVTPSETNAPLHDARVYFYRAIDDIKKLFGNNYHLDSTVDCMLYISTDFDLTRLANNDIFTPYEIITKWKARYTQSRVLPAIHA